MVYDIPPPLDADTSRCSPGERRLIHAGYRPHDFRMDVYTHAVPDAHPIVVLTHMPTGTQASCSDSQSELANRTEAWTQLAALLVTPTA